MCWLRTASNGFPSMAASCAPAATILGRRCCRMEAVLRRWTCSRSSREGIRTSAPCSGAADWTKPGIDPGPAGRVCLDGYGRTRPKEVSMETLVALCKRRGFIFQSSEIYGGINGFFDYGPLGAELKKNIRDCWWDDMVRRRDDVVGIETSIIMHPKVWEASGHVAGFTDPLVDCKVSKQRFRADQLFFAPVVVDGATVGYVSALRANARPTNSGKRPNPSSERRPSKASSSPAGPRHDRGKTRGDRPHPLARHRRARQPHRPALVQHDVPDQRRAMTDASSVAYLRPETAQGMFADFKSVVDTGRVKLPFASRRSGSPSATRSHRATSSSAHVSSSRWRWSTSSMRTPTGRSATASGSTVPGLAHLNRATETHLSEYNHPKEKLAFYSRGTTDIMFRYPFGVQELWGIAARGITT